MNDQSLGSGAIVDPRWLILATGHHQHEPGTVVTVLLGDGRKSPATILGVHEPFDISLIKLVRDGQRVAFALAVGADGWILSKASICRGDITYRLAD